MKNILAEWDAPMNQMVSHYFDILVEIWRSAGINLRGNFVHVLITQI